MTALETLLGILQQVPKFLAILGPKIAAVLSITLAIIAIPYIVAFTCSSLVFWFSIVAGYIAAVIRNLLDNLNYSFKMTTYALPQYLQNTKDIFIRLYRDGFSLSNIGRSIRDWLVQTVKLPTKFVGGIVLAVVVVLFAPILINPIKLVQKSHANAQSTQDKLLNLPVFRTIRKPLEVLFGKLEDTHEEKVIKQLDAIEAKLDGLSNQLEQTRSDMLEQGRATQRTINMHARLADEQMHGLESSLKSEMFDARRAILGSVKQASNRADEQYAKIVDRTEMLVQFATQDPQPFAAAAPSSLQQHRDSRASSTSSPPI